MSKFLENFTKKQTYRSQEIGAICFRTANRPIQLFLTVVIILYSTDYSSCETGFTVFKEGFQLTK